MHRELTNLLPLERQRQLSREYFSRLSVVGILLLTLLVAVAAVLLVPTYVFLAKSSSVKGERLATISSTLSSVDETALSTRLNALSNNAATLAALSDTSSASVIIRSLLAIPRPGITLSGFAYTPTIDKKPGTLAITGSSATRDALRSYQLALQSTSFAVSADLPISVYAKDTDIAFTITVTLAP